MSDEKPVDTVQPPLCDWGALLNENSKVRQRVGDAVRGVSSQVMRREVREAALKFTQGLVAIAAERGIPLPAPKSDFPHNAPLIMTGHQPLLYHPGLLLKEELLNTFAQAQSGVPISVTIDTDEVDSGRITWPAIHDGVLSARESTLARTRDGMCGRQTMAQSEAVLGILAEIRSDLSRGSMGHLEEPVVSALQLYSKLGGVPVAEAHSIVRRVLTGHNHLELPLSAVADLQEPRHFIEAIMADAAGFAALYNEALVEHRREHNIKNAANPFPNMEVSSAQVELPLWTMAGANRQPVRVPMAGGAAEPTQSILPRGSMVTLMLRACCADFFIHGLGGSKYDQFVDRFAVKWLGAELPRFVVASRTQHLFPNKVQQLEAELRLKSQLKEMVSHPQNFVGKGLFSQAEDQLLAEAGGERDGLLALLKQATEGQERSAIAYKLNDLNRRLRDTIHQTQLYQRLQDPACSEAVLRQWRYREFPFFLFKGT
jgi:hypothetical protein